MIVCLLLIDSAFTNDCSLEARFEPSLELFKHHLLHPAPITSPMICTTRATPIKWDGVASISAPTATPTILHLFMLIFWTREHVSLLNLWKYGLTTSHLTREIHCWIRGISSVSGGACWLFLSYTRVWNNVNFIHGTSTRLITHLRVLREEPMWFEDSL